MMTDLLIILGLLVVAAFFWQLRQMAEQSRRFVETECSKQKVQLLSVRHGVCPPLFRWTYRDGLESQISI